MDDLRLDATALQNALNDVSRVNRMLGGNQITCNAVYQLLQKQDHKKTVVIADFGCGDGTMLRKLALYLRKKKIKAQLVGIDINEKSLAIGNSFAATFPEISYRNQDILKLEEEVIIADIVITTLTMHHFTNEELMDYIRRFYTHCTLGVIVNDLQRSALAYYLFKIFSAIFMHSPIAKHDGLISIKRGFQKKELCDFSKALKFNNYSITWKWAFRYLWVIKKSK